MLSMPYFDESLIIKNPIAIQEKDKLLNCIQIEFLPGKTVNIPFISDSKPLV